MHVAGVRGNKLRRLCNELGSDAPKVIDNLVEEYFSIAHQPYLHTPPKKRAP